jgi:raffinose/stachyose/melibiose transport system substrate-binding protein
MRSSKPRPTRALIAVVAGAIALAGCSAGDLGSSDKGSGGKTTVSFLVGNDEPTVAGANGLAKAFNAANPKIHVKVETRPGGTDGDNLVKTRLSTGDMSDVFMYNSGSLFQALSPKTNLVPLKGAYLDNVQSDFFQTVSAGGQKYGVPFGTAMGGGVLYNIPIFKRLGLSVPKTWAEFMANNAKIKAAGIPPVIQTYETDTWTSQLFILADFHNVAAKEPDFAQQYTAAKKKYATDPAALESFKRLQQVRDAGYLNKDFASSNNNDGLKKVATGQGAQYPMLTFTIATIAANTPKDINNVGFFALPGDDAATNGLTTWYPGGVYIPKTTTGAKLAAAKKFVAFVASTKGCDAQTAAQVPQGPYLVKDCTLPASLPQAVKDLTAYFQKPGATSPALEFLSPIKGPSLEQIMVEVGSGIRSAESGAKLYDEDVKKQGQQLGLPGF